MPVFFLYDLYLLSDPPTENGQAGIPDLPCDLSCIISFGATLKGNHFLKGFL